MKLKRIFALLLIVVVLGVISIAAYKVNGKDWKQGWSYNTAVIVDSNSANYSYSDWFDGTSLDGQTTIYLWYDFESDSTIGKDTITIVVQGRHYIEGDVIMKDVDTLSRLASTSTTTTAKTNATTTVTSLSLTGYAPEYRFRIVEQDVTGIARTNKVFLGLYATKDDNR